MQLITVDSSRGELFFKYLDINCINLNCLFRRSMNLDIVRRELQPIKFMSSINLCNLASLCFKLHIVYGSDKCIELVQNIVKIIKEINPFIELIQMQVLNYDEEDLKPISRLYLIDIEKDIIYINRVLKDILHLLGFVDSQIINLPKQIKNIVNYIPKDLCSQITENDLAYERITKLLQ